jgi:hypothetical protein
LNRIGQAKSIKVVRFEPKQFRQPPAERLVKKMSDQ